MHLQHLPQQPVLAPSVDAGQSALFRALTEQSMEFVSIVGADGRFRYVGPSVRSMLGYVPEILVGTFPAEWVHADDLRTMIGTYAALAAGGPGTAATMVVRLRHSDGSWRYFEGSDRNLSNHPAVRGITSTARDVTRRIEAERAMLAAESRFRGFIESSREGVWAIDAARGTTYVNPRVASLLGYRADELLHRDILEFMTADSAAAARAMLVAGLPAEPIELELIRQDGVRIQTLAAASLIDERDTRAGMLVTITDVTERKQHENRMHAALRDADLDRRRLEATIQAMPIGVWLANREGFLTHSNPAAAEVWGGKAPHPRPGEYDVHRGWWPETDEQLTTDDWALARTLRTGEKISGEIVRIERFDGTSGFVINSAAPIPDGEGHIAGAVVATIDITDHHLAILERDRLLASLQTERARLAMLFEHSPVFLAVMRGPEYVVERINPAYQTLVGARDVLGKAIRDALPEIAEQGFIAIVDRVRETGEPFIGRQMPVWLTRVPGAPAETRYIDFVYQRQEDPDGEVRIVVHGVDVTEQVVVTEALRDTEHRLREQFAKLPVPTFLWQASGAEFVLADFNDAGTPLVRQGRGAIGLTSMEIFGNVAWDFSADFERCLREGIVIRRSIAGAQTPGAEQQTFDLTIGPQHPDRVLVHAVDITEQTRLASELRQAQKMEAVGQLAGGIAHDFNNLLTVIGAHSAFLLQGLPEGDARREDALAIQQSGDRAAALTRQLLAFSRKQLLTPAVTDLNTIIEETHRMLGRVLGEDVEVVLDLAPRLGCVLVDIGQVEQVLMNLVLNARDAMPFGGRVSIMTREVGITAPLRLVQDIVVPGRYTILSVIDAGTGMDDDTRARVFEPFFTTKAVDKGTGLGLSTVYGIVKQSDGYVNVESARGEGTRFDVYFPVVDDAQTALAPEGSERRTSRGVETILLVEDDAAVRQIAKRVLVREGYHVLEACDGRSALAIAESHDGPIDAVISDAVMPGMTGAAVLICVLADRPECKPMLMSGYTDDEMARRGVTASNVRFIQKPFTPADFARQVRHVLDTPR